MRSRSRSVRPGRAVPPGGRQQAAPRVREAAARGLQVTKVDGDPLEARRTRRLIAQGDEDQYVVVKLLSKGVA